MSAGRDGELAIVPPGRLEREAARDVFEVRQRFAGEAGGLRLQRHELRVQPIAPVRLRDLGRQPDAQGCRVIAQRRRRPKLLHVHLGLQLGRAEIAIHQARDVLIQPEAEEQVVSGDRIGRRHRPGAAHRERHRCIRSGRGARGAS